MNKIEQLKAAFEASTPGEWRVGDAGRTVFGPKTERPAPETVCTSLKTGNPKFTALAHNMMPEILEALALLKQAAQIIDGEYPESDERFDVAVKAFQLLEKLK